MNHPDKGRDVAALLDRHGNAIPIRENALVRAEFYVLANPIKSTLIALWVGYVIGRLRGAFAGQWQQRMRDAR